jgi:hypothetical protein
MSKVSPQIIEENEHKFEQTMIKLEQVDKLLEQKGKPMNELEQEFMKAVKEGNILLSLEILNKNPSLVNLRDQVINHLSNCLSVSLIRHLCIGPSRESMRELSSPC